ncbi:DUF4065 domain-containing protein [Caldibacillus lycopersici]|uniref:DUF4065 domain-containing protein n=1 Tax=Perspicuibacillus lycopersici TaxID=1325689 RepID=A0AAE3LMY6_9BACI|nr:type II toxin-antitoxin system antitoxin SocA domain-containing protein [Perspicuibacillus lycopersici]MCU9614065.1 DUF4065 domain-containing protein [Perspicuibacillus lycopersici]
MCYDVRTISRWFIENNTDAANASFNGHLKLQKLLYYAQAMNLAVTDKPLFEEKIEAWENGPVVKEMFIEYRHNNFSERVKSLPDDYELNNQTRKILQIVNHIYGTQTGTQLVELTHSEEPWLELKDLATNRQNPVISQEKIHEYYKPLKDLFNLYEDYDFTHEFAEKINGNIFVYNRLETYLDDNDIRNLWEIGEDVKGEKYFVYKDDQGEMVIY